MTRNEKVSKDDEGRYRIILTPINEWKTELALSKSKAILPKLNNLMLIMRNDPRLSGLLSFNEFTQRIDLMMSPPWGNGSLSSLTDDDVLKLRAWLSDTYDVEFSKDNLYNAAVVIASNKRYHPVKQMIERVKWDGVPRAETLFIDYLGAEDNAYTRSVAKTWLTGAVTRIYDPGIKFELVPVLQGKQGRGKSTLANKLGGEWFTDQLADMKGKDSKDFMKGAWIIELSELSAMRKTEIEEVKSFISATVDRYRPAFGRLTQEFLRTGVFMATTNDNGYLKDLTGSRRFAPIVIDDIERKKDVFNIKDETIQQIWAETYTLYKKRQPVYLSNEIEKMADKYRQQAEDDSPIKSMVIDYLDIRLPRDWESRSTSSRRQYISDIINHSKKAKGDVQRDRVTTRDVLIELFNRDPMEELRGDGDAKKISLILNNLPGWKYRDTRYKGARFRGYIRESVNEQE